MKKSIFLIFAAILCAMTANAYDQAAKDLYFDNSEAKWSSCYVYIGKGDYTSCYPLTRVPGTQYLWQLAKAKFNNGSSWNGATGWVLCNEKWWDGNNESIDKYTWHGDKNVTQKSTSAWVDTKIYKTNGTASTKSDNHTINAYKVTSYTKSNYTVTIKTVEGGTLTVKDYDDQAVATGASKIHLTVLKFSAVPASGYVLDGVEINDGTNTTTIAAADLATKTHTLTSAVTITPVWRATTSTVTVTATATNGTVTGGGEYEEGTTAILTATPNSGYLFKNWTVAGAEVSTANPYTFTVNADITVTANFEETPKETVYFVNNGGWTGVSIYGWGGSVTGTGINTWSGVPMTKTGETLTIDGKNYDIYSYSAEVGAVKNILFNYNGDANKTSDFVWTDGKYYYNGAAKDFEGTTKEGVVTALSTPIPDETVYLINTGNWSKAMIHTWNGVGGTAWPGVEMTLTGETIEGYAVYSYTAKQGGQANLLFQESENVNKTGDLEWQAGKYYAPSKNAWYDDAAAAKAALAGPATIVLHGNFVKADWGDTDAFELSADEKTATLTVLIKAGNYEFGVKLNNVWTSNGKAFTKTNNEHVIEAGSGNLTLNADITGNYVFTWTYETNTLTVTYPTEEVVVETNYYVTGTFNNNEPADANYKMTLEGEVYKATVGLKEGENKLKITDGSWDNTWGYGQLGANYQEVSDPNDFNNILITLDEDKNIVVVFDATAGKITFEGLTVAAPAEKHYYIAGTENLTGFNWQVDGLKMTEDAGVYKHTFSALPAGVFEFKVTQGDWEKESWGYNNLGAAYVEVSQGKDEHGNDNGNIKFVTEEAKNITVIFDPAAGKITINGLTEKTPVVEDLSTQPSIIYVKCDGWKADNARFAAYFYGTEETWVNMTDADKDGVYEVVNNKKNKHVIFCRMTPDNNENKWENKWNQSADLEIPTTTYLNYWTVTSTDDVWNNPTGKWMMLIGSGDNSEALAAADGQTVADVYVNRSFDASQLYTIALPFDLSDALTKTHFGNTVSVIKFVQLDKDENDDLVLLFDEALGMAAGKPYVITPSVSVDGFVVNDVDIKNTVNNITQTTTGASVTMEAILSASKNAKTNGKYWLASNTYLYNTSAALKSLRAVFDITTQSNMPPRVRIAQSENVETGLDNNQLPISNIQKLIVNGQLIIIRDGVKYNVQGQKL